MGNVFGTGLSNRAKGLTALGAAALLHAVSTVYITPLKAAPGARTATERAALFFFDTLGVTELAFLLVVASGFYIVGSDLLQNALSTRISDGATGLYEHVDRGFELLSTTLATGSGEIRKELVLGWVRHGQSKPEDLKEIAQRAYVTAYGRAELEVEDYCASLERLLLDNCLAQGRAFRTNHVTQVSIRKNNAPQGLVWWEERKRFNLHLHGPTTYPLRTVSKFEIPESSIMDALRRCRYYINVGGARVASLSLGTDAESTLKQIRSAEGYRSEDKTTHVRYEAGRIEISISAEVRVEGIQGVLVETFERSLVSEDERVYFLTLREPVRNFEITFEVDADRFEIDNFIAGPRHYKRGDGAHAYASQHGWPDEPHFVKLHTEHWVLPGLVLAATWRPL